MEIAAIPGIRAVSAIRAERKDWQAPAIFDLEGAAKPGDEIVQRTGRKAAGAEEDENDDVTSDDEGEPGEGKEKNVDYFA